MTRFLSSTLLFLPLATLLLTAPISAEADDSESAHAFYDQAQALKRDNRLEAARASFQRAAEQSGPDDATWAGLAQEELRYGLPMQEARLLMLQLSGTSDFAGRHQIVNRIDAIHRELLAGNSDRPERIAEIEQQRDQVALVRQSLGQAEQSSASVALNQLRSRIHLYYMNQGQWPDRRFLESELAESLRHSGFREDRIEILNFYPSRELFYATLRDTRSGTETKIKGDRQGVTLEPQ